MRRNVSLEALPKEWRFHDTPERLQSHSAPRSFVMLLLLLLLGQVDISVELWLQYMMVAGSEKRKQVLHVIIIKQDTSQTFGAHPINHILLL